MALVVSAEGAKKLVRDSAAVNFVVDAFNHLKVIGYAAPAEPLLPVEKKLIGWSLGLGIALLIVLTAISRLF